MKIGRTYIMASRRHGTLYVGVTSNLHRRVWQHKTGFYKKSFSKKYETKYLVYFEQRPSIMDAIFREKQIKKYRRSKKITLIEGTNREWYDLAEGWNL